MPSQVYPANVVDVLLKNASEMMHTLTDEIVRLQQEKIANADKVVLEKASNATDPELIRDFTNLLVDRSLVPAEYREKVAGACGQGSDEILSVAIEAFKRYEAPSSSGRGITSTGAYGSKDIINSAWSNVGVE